MKLKTYDLPSDVLKMIEENLQGKKLADLSQNSTDLSRRYRCESGTGKSLLSRENEAWVYAAVRMPATFAAVTKALNETLDNLSSFPKSVLDVGAGTGAAAWAVDGLLNLSHITCWEREKAMANVGQTLMKNSSSVVLQKALWKNVDITTLSEAQSEKFDLILVSYCLNELYEQTRLQVISRLWNMTEKVLLVIEPGTSVGYQNLMQIRNDLIDKGAFIAAPCPHNLACPLKQGDWCHFSARLNRTKLHKNIKNASMGREDEKFCYMAFTKEKILAPCSRIIRPPRLEKYGLMLQLCAKNGLKNLLIPKKSDDYAQARKKEWGNVWNDE